MTVQTETRQVVHNGNDSATTFPFSFKVISSADLRVTLTSGTTDTVLVLDTDYTVTLNEDQEASPGGSVEYPLDEDPLAPGDPLATGDTLQIDTNMSALQEDDLQTGRGFSPTVLENRLDALTIMLQQIKRDVARAPRLPNTFPANSALSRALSVAGRFVGVDADGNWTTLSGTGSATDASEITLAAENYGEVDMLLPEFLECVGVNVKRFGAVGDGVTDDSAAINAATYYLYKTFNGGNVVFPPGVYLCATTLFPRSRVNWIGQATTGYFATGTNGVVIKRHSALTILAYQTASLWTCRNIEFEGNGGGTGTYIFARPPGGIPLPADDPLRPGTTTYSIGSGMYLYNCTLSSAQIGIGDSTGVNSINAVDCMFRDFTTAISNITDSTLDRCLFTGQTFAGVSLNTGANRINNCFFEFNRNGSNGAYGIFIQNNATEIQIQGCRFDRNAGQDIYVTSGTKRPKGILIQGNFFNRSAWGANVTIRAPIYADGVDGITVTNNTVKAYSSFPSTVMGVVSPISLFAHENCTGVLQRDNNTVGLCREMPLTTANPSTAVNEFGNAWSWTQSANGTDEWYLKDYYNTGNNPYIDEPDFISVNGTLLTAGTAGSLPAGGWDWADNDSLGYSTIYCRVSETGEPGLQDIRCFYDEDPYPSQLNTYSITSRSTDVQTDEWADVYLNRAHAGRTLVANNATAAISSNVLSITVADGHGIEAGDWLFLDDAVTVSVPDGAYQVLSVTDAGGGNDYINVSRTAADASGTIDIYTVVAREFTLRTRKRCMFPTGANDFGSLPVTLSVVVHGLSPAYRLNSEWPFTVVRNSSSALPAILNGTIVDHNSNLAHDWYDTGSNDNLSIDISSDILGDKLTVRVINTTADDVAYQIGIRR